MVLLLLALSLMVPAALYTVCNPGAVGDRIVSAGERIFRRHRTTEPVRRPIEEIAAEIRRLGRRYHSPQVSHIKADSIRQAYDQTLIEGCTALDIEHLMTVLSPGPDLDRERARVEQLLHRWGVELDLGDAA